MINLALKTEYSFKHCFGHIQELVDSCKESALGIADMDNTYGHVLFGEACKKADIKPIYGVRLRYTVDPKQRTCQYYWVFLAKNDEGLKEIYRLVTKAYENFYYFPRLLLDDLSNISDNVISIQPDMDGRIMADYQMLTPCQERIAKGINMVAMQDNYYPNEVDKEIYELLAGARKDKGGGYIHFFDDRPCPMHIVSDEYFRTGILRTTIIANECNASIQKAEMVKFSGSANIRDLCTIGAKRLNLPMDKEPYQSRLERELSLIEEKGYEDYFLIVADMLRYANKQMLVGPSRGSSAGSLVCYLLDITKIDPIEHDLLFERFIDVNRFDLPDIDIDFPDSKRVMVIDYLVRKYGRNNVKNLANINRLKAKSAIDLFGMGMAVPKGACETVKNAMIERSAGDARNDMCIGDTFNDTEPGQDFISEYPKMRLVERIENHAQHAGKHAAGIIVSNLPLTNFGSVTAKSYAGVPGDTIMVDKNAAEIIDLLKIDCLGLTCLTILEESAKLIKKPKDFYYSLELDDDKTFKIFRDGRLNGIFQFEGQALKMLTKSIDVNHFDDIVAITALARPGALRSGGAAKFAKRRSGNEQPIYFGSKHKSITESTLGIMVYQEQMMFLAKDLAEFSWMEINDMRKAASKSKGDDYFSRYEKKFIDGCKEFSGLTTEEAEAVWKDIQHAGSWIFNKAHAVAYGMLSYYTAYMKANHPLEFYAATLNNAKNEDSALRVLRDGVENDGIEYTAVDVDESMAKWAVVDGKLLGGLCNIKGVAEKKAEVLIKARNAQKWTDAQLKLMMNPKTAFDILFPTQHHWGHYFDKPTDNGLYASPTLIRDIDKPGDYMIIGRLIDRNLNDLNEYNKVVKRGHKLEDHTVYLNIIIEDDYDSIMCSIGRYEFDRLHGRHIAESAKVGEDWYLVKGKMSGSWRGITVEEIINLSEL